jgi:hypothetical protein
VASIIQGHDGHEHHCWDERGISTKKGVQMEWVYVCGVVHNCRLGRWRVCLLDSACTVTPTSPQHDQYSTTRLQPTSSRSAIIIVRLAQVDSLDQLYSLKVKCCCSNLAPGTRPHASLAQSMIPTLAGLLVALPDAPSISASGKSPVKLFPLLSSALLPRAGQTWQVGHIVGQLRPNHGSPQWLLL